MSSVSIKQHQVTPRMVVLAALLVIAMVAGGVSSPTRADASSGGAPMLLGLAVGGDWRGELDDFAAQQGKAPALDQIFWEPSIFEDPQPWAGGILSDLHGRGITAWVEWTTDDLAAMADGRQDRQMRNMFASVKDFLLGGSSRSMILAPLPEANLDEHPWSKDPVAFQHGFRRMRVLAAEAGLGPEQIRFAFSVNGVSTHGRAYEQFYPGDAHVDLVAFARLNRGTDHPDGWRDYAETFTFGLERMRAQIGTTKPIMISQTGTVANGGNRDTWLADMFRGLVAERDVIGAIYFNRDRGSNFLIHNKAQGLALNATFRSGYKSWSPPSAADWVFDGSLDAWVTARGGTPATWPPTTHDQPPATNPFGTDLALTARVGASTPIANAVAISQARFSADDARHVVLSRDDKFPDALAGTPLLGEGPLLLTPTAGLPSAVRAELDRVLDDGGRVYLLGGPGALSAQLEGSLTRAGYDVVRLSGTDRFKTARAIAEQVASLYPASAATVLVARGFGTDTNPTAAWADSVTGGGYAASARRPVVLSASHELSAEARDFLGGRELAVLLGGPGALSEKVLAEAGAVAASSRRVAGTARDLTAVTIVTELWQRPVGEFRMIIIDGFGVDGWAFGLPAAGLSADFSAPLLPVAPDALPAGTAAALRSCFSKRVATIIVGTSSVISNDVLASVEAHDHSC
ncbi:MAG: hypothetical protein ACI867_000309 [Glaciecola sp.]|jgi:hypothetical protein